MCVSPYGWYLPAIMLLWAVWLIVLCRERGWFKGVWAALRAMDPLTCAVMAALCAYCTVSAQKPGGTNESQTVSQQEYAESVGPAFQAGTALETQAGPLSATSESARVVFQSTPVYDPRTVIAFDAEPGWCGPAAVPVTPELDALSFAGGGTNTPSPVRFADTEEVAVQTLILATRGDPADLATLIDAPATARLRITADGSQEAEMSAAERSLTEQFLPSQWLIVEIDFETPESLAGLFFGGSAGRPGWSRDWRGEIAEIVGFDTPPDADVRAGVANYLSIRWDFGGHPATPEQRQAAINAGLYYGVVWGSVLILK